MKEYAAYHNHTTDKNLVIAKDEDGYWFNFIPDAGLIDDAKETAEALNAAEREKRKDW